MAGSKEKRMFERYDYESNIVFSAMGPGSYNNAQLNNCSSGGMYFNSDYEIIRGSDVCIKMVDYRSIFHAKVVRCKEMEVDGKTCYGIGIEYLEPEL